MQRLTELIRGSLRTMAAAVAGAIALAGCANFPADDASAPADATQPAPTAATATPPVRPATPAAAAPPPATTAKPPTKTVTLPPKDRISLSEYRVQMREQLMKSDHAAPDVADCAAHASWVIPRSPNFDALKIPTGALGAGKATVEPWEGRFSQGKQAVPVKSVVTFQATAHKRSNTPGQWDPIQVRCGYDDGMMLAYELLDADGTAVSEPSAAPAVAPRATGKSRKASHGKSSAKTSAKTSTKSTAKATSSSKSTSKSTSAKSSTAKKKQ